MKKYSKSLSVFSLIFFVIVFSSCMESSIRTRIIYLDGSGGYAEPVKEPYRLYCHAGFDNYLEIPYIPEGSGYTTINAELRWEAYDGIQAAFQLMDDTDQASSTINFYNYFSVVSGACLKGATYNKWVDGNALATDCADKATRLQFYIFNNNWQPTDGIIYIKKIWLSGSWQQDLILFESTDYYYQQDYYQIDYTNYTGSDYSIKVRNESNTNVVCFKGAPSESTLISGVRAGTTCGLKYDKNLFYNSGDFVLWVITAEKYELYKAGKLDYYELQRNPFALIYAYYNADSISNSNLVYTISANMGGTNYLLINNPTKYNFELRQNGLYGEALTFVPANTVQTKINLQAGDYIIYPVIRKLQRRFGEIVNWALSTDVNRLFYIVYSLDYYSNYEFNPYQYFDTYYLSNYAKPISAYVTVMNANNGTGVSLYRGANSEAYITSTGGRVINSGKSLAFEIPLTNYDYNKDYFPSSTVVSGWRIGNSMNQVEIPQATLEAGKMYYLDVTGNSYYDITAQWRTNTDGVIISDYINFDED